jgi:hypothetical protein
VIVTADARLSYALLARVDLAPAPARADERRVREAFVRRLRSGVVDA